MRIFGFTKFTKLSLFILILKALIIATSYDFIVCLNVLKASGSNSVDTE